MKKPLDRKYVLVALRGLLLTGRRYQHFLVKYQVTPEELRFCLLHRIRALMENTFNDYNMSDHKKMVRKIRRLANKHGVTEAELQQAAWEVLRGAIVECRRDTLGKSIRRTVDERAHTAFRALKFFLMGKNRPLAIRPFYIDDADFSIERLVDKSVPYDAVLLDDLTVLEFEATPPVVAAKELPEEIQELLQDVGMI